MTSIAVLLLIVALLAIAALWHKRYGGYMPEPYRSRPCQGFAWKRAYPSSSAIEIRSLLRVFARAFAYRDAQMLQVGPEDRVIDVYRAEYPQTGSVDGLELETFAAAAQRKYRIDFNAIWDEMLTFGALFAACQEAKVAKDHEHEA